MAQRFKNAIGVISILLIVLICWSLYQSYRIEGFSSEFASTLGTLTLVILTAWYAFSTSKLIEVNEKQIDAARASSMPALDVEYTERGSGEISLSIRNRGQGVARNVSIIVTVVGRRIDTFQADLSDSLPPEYEFYKNGREGFLIQPRFYTKFTEKTYKEILNSPDEIEPSPDLITRRAVAEEESISDEDSRTSPISNMKEWLTHVGMKTDFESPVPIEEGSLKDIIELNTEARVEDYSPAVYLQITFTDVMYGERHVETVIDGGYVNPEKPSLNDILPGSHLMTSRITGRSSPFREIHGDIVKSSQPFVKELDVNVQPTSK